MHKLNALWALLFGIHYASKRIQTKKNDCPTRTKQAMSAPFFYL